MSPDAECTPEQGDCVIFQLGSERRLGIVRHRFMRSAGSGEELPYLRIQADQHFSVRVMVTESGVVDIVRPETANGRVPVVPFLASDDPEVRSWALRALAGEGGT